MERNRKLWEKQGRNNDLRKDIARAFVERSLLNRLKTLVDDEIVIPLSAGSALIGKSLDFGFASDLGWYVSASHAKLVSDLSLSVAADVPHDLDQIESNSIEKRALRTEIQAARSDAGRYTILEASKELAKATGWLIDRWVATMCKAVRTEKLPLRNPKNFTDRLPYEVPNEIRNWYDEVDNVGLNAWLTSNPEWCVKYRFPTSNGGALKTPTARVKAVPRWQAHETEILGAIRYLGYDPQALPTEPNGLPGIPSKVREQLPHMTRDIFDKAWRRALKDNSIKRAK